MSRRTSPRRHDRIPLVSSEIVAAWVGAVATMASAAAAGMAWRAAKSSADAASELTQLEAGRRHGELTPRLTVQVEAFNPGDTQHYRVTLGLDGPLALLKLDSLTVTVRDDRPGRDQDTFAGGEATPEAVRAQVWGPLRFSPGLGAPSAKADATGRSVTVTQALDVGEGITLQMERTSPPTWYRHQNASGEVWRREVGALLRLSVLAGSEAVSGSWVLPVELDLAMQGVEGFDSRLGH